MGKFLVSALALAAMTSATFAAEAPRHPVKMTDAQLDSVVAGQACEGLVTLCAVSVGPVNVAVPVSAAVQALTSNSNASSGSPIATATGSNTTGGPGIIR